MVEREKAGKYQGGEKMVEGEGVRPGDPEIVYIFRDLSEEEQREALQRVFDTEIDNVDEFWKKLTDKQQLGVQEVWDFHVARILNGGRVRPEDIVRAREGLMKARKVQ